MLKQVAFFLALVSSTGLYAADFFGFLSPEKVSFQSAVPATPKSFSASFPSMTLIDQRNQNIDLGELFNNDHNVVFAFFFSHCVTVCTTVTLSLKSIQSSMPERTRFVMISIDPEVDTPDVLKKYAESHEISESNWYLLTGSLSQIIELQKQFEAYRGNKMNHSTSLFVKAAHSNVIHEVSNNFSSIPKLLSLN
jgi:cytochrome oxidase Cu insertion factor (SCO1/SenC/PrrC family)